MGNRERARPARLAVAGVLLIAASSSLTAQPPSATLTAERVAVERDRDKALGDHLLWSPDGKQIAFLRTVVHAVKSNHGPGLSETESAEIRSIDAATGLQTTLLSSAQLQAALAAKPPPPLGDRDQSAARSQLRGFAWAPDSHALLLSSNTALVWFDLQTAAVRPLASGESQIGNPTVSPNGRYVAFVRDRSLWCADSTTGALRQIARPAAKDIREGQPDWVYEHEFGLRSAFQWSPDSSAIAWLETDDSAVQKYPLRDSSGEEHPQPYPKPGGSIPVVRLFVRTLSAGKPVRIDLGSNADNYVPRFQWSPDSRHLAVERLARNQKTLDLLLANLSTGQTQLLLSEKDAYWINIADNLHFLEGGRFLWTSERSGYRHLYLYDAAGRLLSQLTQGNWEVTSLAAVDEAANAVYFTATEASPRERHLYRVQLDGTGFTRITREKGTHQPLLSPAGGVALDTWSTLAMPPHRDLLALDGHRIASVPGSLAPVFLDDAAAAKLPLPEFLTVKSHMAQPMSAYLIKPPDFDPSRHYPVIFYLASGPGQQSVTDAWGGDLGLWLASMAQNGYVVFALDHRGAAGYGHFFEEPLHLRFGASEMADIRDGILYLHTQPWVDKARIGACGWGFGGFLALHAMLDRPILFKAGFAGSPITDWHLDNAVFTERYLEDPIQNQDGWLASSPLENAKYLNGPMLLAQGTIDENVHPENSLLLLDELLDKGKYADILLFADRSDLFAEPGPRRILFQRLTDFFLKNL